MTDARQRAIDAGGTMLCDNEEFDCSPDSYAACMAEYGECACGRLARLVLDAMLADGVVHLADKCPAHPNVHRRYHEMERRLEAAEQRLREESENYDRLEAERDAAAQDAARLAEAVTLEPVENMALTVALSQIERGVDPGSNMTAVLVYALGHEERVKPC